MKKKTIQVHFFYFLEEEYVSMYIKNIEQQLLPHPQNVCVEKIKEVRLAFPN